LAQVRDSAWAGGILPKLFEAMEIEMASESKHTQLNTWIKEMADLCTPDKVHWCDGSYV
jgi:GTP-dependent phosphoenolpyruvate carboxykinase